MYNNVTDMKKNKI